MALGILGARRIDQFDPEHQATAANITQLRKVLLQATQMPAETLTHRLGMGAQVVVLDVLHHRRTRRHGHLVAAEGAGMGTRLPGVEPLTIDHHGQRQAAADGFGHHHHIGNDAGVLKGKHLAGTRKPTLDFIDNQRHTGLLGNPPHAAQPLEISRNHPAFALHGLDNYRRRQLHAAFRIVKQVLQVVQVDLDPGLTTQSERATVIVGIRQELHAIAQQCRQGLFRPQTAHQAQCALRHAVISALERQYGAASGGSAHQLQRRFHRIGPGRSAELDLRLVTQGVWQQAEEVLNELVFDRCSEVKGMQRQLIGQHLLNRLDHYRVVVSQRQGAGAGQAIDELTPFDVFDIQATGLFQCQRDAPRVAAGIGLLLLLAGQQR